MPRIARMKMKGDPAVYHVISRTALEGFVLGDVEKDFLWEVGHPILVLSRKNETL